MVTIGTLNGGNITITTGPAARSVTRIWWSDDESDYSDCPSNDGTFDDSCFPEGKSNIEAVKIEFGSDVTSIGEAVFYECYDLTSVTIPDSVTSIGQEAFINCEGMTNMTIGNGVTSIGQGAFVSCWRLTSVALPNSVTSIGESAFLDCSELTSMTIPDSVTNIDLDAFLNSGLASVTITANGGNAENVKQMLINAGVSSSITWNMPS